jgi:S-adenosyl methyltransferase
MAAVPSGSYLAISHRARDIQVAPVSEGNRYNERSAVALNLRTRAEVTAMFASLELIPPASPTGPLVSRTARRRPGHQRDIRLRCRGPQALTPWCHGRKNAAATTA